MQETRDASLIPEWGRTPGNSLQYFCLRNPMDRWAWKAAVHRFGESDRTEVLCMHVACIFQRVLECILAWHHRTKISRYLNLKKASVKCPSYKGLHVAISLSHREGISVQVKTLENPLDCRGIQPVHPKGNRSWIFFGKTDVEAETPILWSPDAKS